MMCTLERKISAAQTRAWRAVPGNVDAQTFASLLSLISTLSQTPVWMHFISIPLLVAIWRAQEQWMSDTEYFCYHYSLSVKGTKQLLHISLTKSCVSNCLCWFHYTNEPLTSPRKPLPCVGFIQQDSLVYQQLRGNLGFISMLVMLNLFRIFYQKCHPSAKMQTWTRTNLAGADSAVDKGSAGSWHWTIHIIPAQKAVSTLRSFLLSCRLLLTKLAEVMMNLVWFGFSVSSHEDTQGDWRVSSYRKLALMTGWMSHVQHYTQLLFWENTRHCAMFGCSAVWQGRSELPIWACGFSQSIQNSTMQ